MYSNNMLLAQLIGSVGAAFAALRKKCDSTEKIENSTQILTRLNVNNT